MALDFQHLQSGLESRRSPSSMPPMTPRQSYAARTKARRHETRVSNVDCQYTTPQSNGTVRIVINLEKEP